METKPQIDDSTGTHIIFMSIAKMEGKIATDQTKPHITRIQGMVVYVVNANAIIAEPLKSKSSAKMLQA